MSPRPRIPRRVLGEPEVAYFKPVGVRMRELEQVTLTMDEFEAFRLKDFLGIGQSGAAERMGISQPTFQRLLFSSRGKVAEAIVKGKAIRIEGGDYRIYGRGGDMKGRGRMGGTSMGPSGSCSCPECDHFVAHERGVPCAEMKCPKCGSKMARMG